MHVQSYCSDALRFFDGTVARLEINRPKACNAVTEEMWQAIEAIASTVARSQVSRVLVITGSGKHFSAGADISEFPKVYATAEGITRYNATFAAAEAAIRNIPKPVIARVRGACVGGALGLALAADFRFGDVSCSFAVTASKLGIAYSPEDTARLIETVGVSLAKDMLFSARTVGSDEALKIGVIDRLVPVEDLDECIDAFASELAKRSRASIAVMKAMALGLTSPERTTTDGLRTLYSDLFLGQEFREGYSTFLKQRPPQIR
jgi:enoyl-CoA hydratase/carnithine racemase